MPIRVELQPLTPSDFNRILTEPDASLVEQYIALLGTEGIEVTFTDEALTRVAEFAWQVNENTENIGARRLHTVMERLMDEVSFSAGDTTNALHVDTTYVNDHLENLVVDQDLSRYIL